MGSKERNILIEVDIIYLFIVVVLRHGLTLVQISPKLIIMLLQSPECPDCQHEPP